MSKLANLGPFELKILKRKEPCKMSRSPKWEIWHVYLEMVIACVHQMEFVVATDAEIQFVRINP